MLRLRGCGVSAAIHVHGAACRRSDCEPSPPPARPPWLQQGAEPSRLLTAQAVVVQHCLHPRSTSVADPENEVNRWMVPCQLLLGALHLRFKSVYLLTALRSLNRDRVPFPASPRTSRPPGLGSSPQVAGSGHARPHPSVHMR